MGRKRQVAITVVVTAALSALFVFRGARHLALLNAAALLIPLALSRVTNRQVRKLLWGCYLALLAFTAYRTVRALGKLGVINALLTGADDAIGAVIGGIHIATRR